MADDSLLILIITVGITVIDFGYVSDLVRVAFFASQVSPFFFVFPTLQFRRKYAFDQFTAFLAII